MKYLFAFSFLALFFIGCFNNSEQLPSGVLPKAKMETILWQLTQADEFFANFVINKDSSKNNLHDRSSLYQKVLKLNKVDKETFKKSYYYYIQHPEISKVMFDSITVRGTRIRNDYNAQKFQPKKDTLAKDSSTKKTLRRMLVNNLKKDSVVKKQIDSSLLRKQKFTRKRKKRQKLK